MTIRKTIVADAEALPGIERSAGAAFRQIPHLGWIAEGDGQSVERHLQLIAAGTSWVAANPSDEPVGFINAERMGDRLQVLELSVRQDCQRMGIGRALVEAVQRWASDHEYAAVTLTTFRVVPWNEPFYRSLGFRTLNEDELSSPLLRILSAEADAGLPRDERCAMIWSSR
ncbi:GNAT family N-acetyltransferase [Consotaella salsifontis]|uniref:GNAT family N-acetyltransferase n=1 Tax=Consotaella salsifontis TaxID=1365950 RepID=UPI001A964863|nr:GNAT family N-acetyltransferase [Consotaella salsifontis]